MAELIQVPGAWAIAAGAAFLVAALAALLAAYERRRRRRAERAARDARAQAAAISGTMREGVIAYDLDLRLVYLNPAFERLTGYPADEIRDQEFLQYIHPDDRAGLLAEWDRLAQGGVLRNQEYRIVTRTGQARWSSSTWEPIRDESGQQIGYLGNELDITDRKLAEAELLQDTELFQAVLEVQQAVAAAGLDSRAVMDLIAEKRRAFADRDAKALRLFSGLMEAALANAAAFEARQARLEERTSALQESEQRFKQVVDAAQEGVWVADERGAITYVNQRLAELLGYQNGALLGRAVSEFIDPGSRASDERGELRFRRRDGSEAWALVSASPIVGRDGTRIGTVGMLTDVTERKRDEDRRRGELTRRVDELEGRLAETGATLRAAIAELETLLYAMSHDLQEPLRHIGGFAHLLLEDGGPSLDPAARHHAERIREGVGRLSGLVDDLLTLARITRQDLLRRRVDLGAAVEEVVSRLRRAEDLGATAEARDHRLASRSEGRDREVDWQIETLPAVEADPALVKLALTHLLANALKFTRPRERAVVRVVSIERDGQAGLAVADNGVGFKMAHAGKLFGVFQRLHRTEEFEGNGTGLAIVHRIAQKHGGHAWAEAAEDAGATFSITFGSAAGALAGEAARAPAGEPAANPTESPAEDSTLRPVGSSARER